MNQASVATTSVVRVVSREWRPINSVAAVTASIDGEGTALPIRGKLSREIPYTVLDVENQLYSVTREHET